MTQIIGTQYVVAVHADANGSNVRLRLGCRQHRFPYLVRIVCLQIPDDHFAICRAKRHYLFIFFKLEYYIELDI